MWSIYKLTSKVTTEVITINIEEEYGYRSWIAHVTPEEFEIIKKRWKTIRGLHCCVPVNLIIPQAIESFPKKEYMRGKVLHCHIHQSDDSFLDEVEYKIPEAEEFEIDGRVFSLEELSKWKIS